MIRPHLTAKNSRTIQMNFPQECDMNTAYPFRDHSESARTRQVSVCLQPLREGRTGYPKNCESDNKSAEDVALLLNS